MGTLDSLVALSDTLAKDDQFAEQLVKNLGNQLANLLNNVKDRIVESLQVDGRTLQNYLSSFRWDSAKFNVNLKSADALREDINKVRVVWAMVWSRVVGCCIACDATRLVTPPPPTPPLGVQVFCHSLIIALQQCSSHRALRVRSA